MQQFIINHRHPPPPTLNHKIKVLCRCNTFNNILRIPQLDCENYSVFQFESFCHNFGTLWNFGGTYRTLTTLLRNSFLAQKKTFRNRFIFRSELCRLVRLRTLRNLAVLFPVFPVRLENRLGEIHLGDWKFQFRKQFTIIVPAKFRQAKQVPQLELGPLYFFLGGWATRCTRLHVRSTLHAIATLDSGSLYNLQHSRYYVFERGGVY